MKFIFVVAMMTCITRIPNHSETDVAEIGTQFHILVDSSRNDPHYSGHRIVNIKIWYPIQKTLVTLENRSEFIDHLYLVSGNSNNVVSENSDKFAAITSKAIRNAMIRPSEIPFPIIIFSPSLGGNLHFYTSYAEFLVSKGYVVIGINHLYESSYVINHHYQVIPQNHVFHGQLKNLSIPDEITADDYRFRKGERQHVLGGDILFVINELNSLNKTLLNNQLDLNTIGVFGHSIGGAAVISAAMNTNQIKAVIDLDGTPPSTALTEGLDQPFLFLEDWVDYHQHPGYQKLFKRRSDFMIKNKGDSFRILYHGFNHNTFLDLNVIFADSDEEKINAAANISKVQEHMIQFFDVYLKGGEFIFEQNDTLYEFFDFRAKNKL